jgi:peptidoglycan/LPS O-acetylase OafA/YrhL
LVLLVATSSLFWFNRDANWDNWALYFFGSYGLGAAAWWASRRKQMSAWLGVIATVAIAALILDFRLRIALALAIALVLGFGRRSGLLERWPDAKSLAFLGQISYSVFLVHFPICLLANALFANLALLHPPPPFLACFWRGPPALPAATLFYRWIESPVASRRITGALAEELQRLRVGQRFDVLHRLAMHHVAHRQFDDLADLVRGMSATCTTLAGTWRGVVLSRICCLMRSISSSSSAAPRAA